MRTRPLLAAGAVAAALPLAACGTISAARPHVASGTPTQLGGMPITQPHDGVREPTRDPGTTEAPTVPGNSTTARGSTAGERRVCRRGSWPKGWIAVSYVDGDNGCTKSGKDEKTGAILVSYADQPREARLDICADQHAPYGWLEEDRQPNSDQCDRAGVVSIRRQR